VVSVAAYLGLLALVGLERVAELVVSRRNMAWSLARGGREVGQEHYRAMVVMHLLFLVSCAAEVVLLDRPFLPWLGWTALAVVLAAQALRWWCIATLGHQWNTRVVVVPGLPRVTGGPYRWMRHPNYVAVVAEIAALPLVHSAWLTALVFTVLNALVLRTRLRVENEALTLLREPA
jgi:methyltransferase